MAEPAPGYPKRPVPRDEAAARALKARTLTNLYNTRPQWLADAHSSLDAAVAAACGLPEEVGEEKAVRALRALNAGAKPGEPDRIRARKASRSGGTATGNRFTSRNGVSSPGVRR